MKMKKGNKINVNANLGKYYTEFESKQYISKNIDSKIYNLSN